MDSVLTSDERKALMNAAAEARRFAYCPYSGFAVGAALLCEGGRIYSGANFENVSFGAGTCAERVALGCAITAGERKFRAAAVCGRGAPKPCGICRQALSEFGSTEVICFDPDSGIETTTTLEQLFPNPFSEL